MIIIKCGLARQISLEIYPVQEPCRKCPPVIELKVSSPDELFHQLVNLSSQMMLPNDDPLSQKTGLETKGKKITS